MKNVGIMMVILVLSGSLFAQQNENNEEVEVTTNTINSNEEFIEQFQWLMETPVNEQEEKRRQVMASLSMYIENNPELEIVLDPKVVNFAEDNPDLLLIFMGGWAKYAFENKDFKNRIEGNLAGIDNVIFYYEANQAFLEDDKKVEKYKKLKEKGKLEKRIQKKVN